MKKAIFWDSDGTLLYGNESFKLSLVRAYKELGYDLSENSAGELMHASCSWFSPDIDHSSQSGEEWWSTLLSKFAAFGKRFGVHDGDIEKINARFRRLAIDYEYELYPDALETLHYFCENGWENYIISNNFPELYKVFDRLGAGKYLSGVFVSACAGYEKPRAEIFRFALEKAGTPDVCYMVGDNPVTDYIGGTNAGMKAILVRTEPKNGEVFCKTLTEIRSLIN